MTPDFKRLCEAAAAEISCPYDEEGRPLVDAQDRADAAEAIVRAVLAELKVMAEESPRSVTWTTPMDQSQLVALTATMVRGGKIEAVADRPIVAALVDHILAEPAKA